MTRNYSDINRYPPLIDKLINFYTKMMAAKLSMPLGNFFLDEDKLVTHILSNLYKIFVKFVLCCIAEDLS